MLRHAFGPGDITAVAIVPGKALGLEEITDFSISTHFDKIPVRRLGHRLAVGWATGSGSIAGTLVCAQMTQGALYKLRQHAGAIQFFRDQTTVQLGANPEVGGSARARLDYYTSSILPEQLPPFHLMFVHANESGQMAIARLYNVVISDHGETKGARNLFTEETLQYQASYYEQIRLHRALTTDQLAALAKKPVGFFSDIRAIEKLPESLANIGKDFSDGNAYLLAETEEVQRRLRAGESTSQGVADEGTVVFVRLPDSGGAAAGSTTPRVVEAVTGRTTAGTVHTYRGQVREKVEFRPTTTVPSSPLVFNQGAVLQITGGTPVAVASADAATQTNVLSNGQAQLTVNSRYVDANPLSTRHWPGWTVNLTSGPQGSYFANVNPRAYYDAVMGNDGPHPVDMVFRPDAVELHVSAPVLDTATTVPATTAAPDEEAAPTTTVTPGAGALPKITRKARYHEPAIAVETTPRRFVGFWRGKKIDLLYSSESNTFEGIWFDKHTTTPISPNVAKGILGDGTQGGVQAKVTPSIDGSVLTITLTIADRDITSTLTL